MLSFLLRGSPGPVSRAPGLPGPRGSGDHARSGTPVDRHIPGGRARPQPRRRGCPGGPARRTLRLMADLPYPEPDVHLAAEVGVLAPELARLRPELGRMLRTQRWKRYGRVVVMHNGPLTPQQLLWVALLRSPRGVVLAGLTAAARRGLRGHPPERPELLVPAAGPLPHLQGVEVARTRRLTAADVHPSAQPPQLTLPRALIDRASRVDRPDDVRALLCAGVQQGRVRGQDLRGVTLRLGPVRHRALLLRTIDDIEGGAHSVRELQFLRLLRSGGLPQPERQVVRQHKGGRHYLDARGRGTPSMRRSTVSGTCWPRAGRPTSTVRTSSLSVRCPRCGCASRGSGWTSGRRTCSTRCGVA